MPRKPEAGREGTGRAPVSRQKRPRQSRPQTPAAAEPIKAQDPGEVLEPDEARELAAHRERAGERLRQWLGGELEFPGIPELTPAQGEEVRRLFDAVEIESSDAEDYGCGFTIAGWSAFASYTAGDGVFGPDIHVLTSSDIPETEAPANSPQQWLCYARACGADLPLKHLFAFVHLVAFPHEALLPNFQDAFREAVLTSGQPPYEQALYQWLAGDRGAIPLRYDEHAEVLRLHEATRVVARRFRNYRRRKPPNTQSEAAFSIGGWRGLALWNTGSSPRLRFFHLDRATDAPIPFSGERGGLEDWHRAAELAETTLGLDAFACYVHLIAFDLDHPQIKDHRPRFETELRPLLRAYAAAPKTREAARPTRTRAAAKKKRPSGREVRRVAAARVLPEKRSPDPGYLRWLAGVVEAARSAIAEPADKS